METIENLGLYLRNIREERKIPIAQIAQVLRTKPETVQALESNEFQKIPAPTYVKGYLRSYSNYLGIDSDHIISEYNRQYPVGSKQVLILEGQKLPRVGIDMKKILKPKLLISIGTLISFILIISLFITLKPHKKTASGGKIPAVFTEPKTENKTSTSSASTTTEQSKLTAPITTPMLLSVHTLDTVWLRIYSDGKLVFEGTLKKNEDENWQAKNEFKLRIGNPSKLNLTLNGQFIGNVSPYGPINIIINEKGIKIDT